MLGWLWESIVTMTALALALAVATAMLFALEGRLHRRYVPQHLRTVESDVSQPEVARSA